MQLSVGLTHKQISSVPGINLIVLLLLLCEAFKLPINQTNGLNYTKL